MTLERSHGKQRLQRPRLRDISAGDADRDPRRDRDDRGRFAPGNAVGRHRAAKRSLTATLRAAIATAVGSTGVSETAALRGAQLAQQALTLYRAGLRELGTGSPIAASHVLRWAVSTTLAQQLEREAQEAGLGSDRAARALELADRLAGRAERASIAAVTLAKALQGQGDAPTRPPWLESDDSEGGA